jgi:hypothetical protein
VPRMYYQNFDKSITAKYGVVVENWALPKFCNPSEIHSQNEVKVLLNALQSGATRFRKLSAAELEEWDQKQFEDELAETGVISCANGGISNGPISPGDCSRPMETRTEPIHGASIQLPSTIPSPADVPPSLELVGRPEELTMNPRRSIGAIVVTNRLGVVVVRKPRKTRSDKGQVRGQRVPKNLP